MIFDKIFIIICCWMVICCQQIHCEDKNYDDNHHQELNELFEKFNREILEINHQTAQLAWDTNFHEDVSSNEKSLDTQQFIEDKTNWSVERCSKLNALKDLFDRKQARIYEILCLKQLKFTGDQQRKFYELSNEVEKVFTEIQICVPRSLDICLHPQKLQNSTFIHFKDDDDIQRIFLIDDSHVSIKTQNAAALTSSMRCFYGEPDLERLMSNEFQSMDMQVDVDMCKRNRNLIYYWIWESWRLAVGPRIKSIYMELVELENIGARNSGFKDVGDLWRSDLEFEDDDNVDQVTENLMNDIQPFYNLLCDFVKTIMNSNVLPAHLMGWNANWNNLFKFEIAPKIFNYHDWNLDDELKMKKWTSVDIVKRIEDFYTSTGLPHMTETFWNLSLIGDKNNFNCHGTAADMFYPNDFRIVTCGGHSLYDFYVIVHEMGHIEQYMLSANQPAAFRAGNSIIQETIGDAFFIAMMSPIHLNRIKLIDDEMLFPAKTNDFDLELLMMLAFMKIPEIPAGYVLEKFRYDLFSQRINADEANDYFWDLTKKFQQISPPSNIDRHELFDASAKFHLAANIPYARYFFANILQFQVFKALCVKTIYGSLNQTEFKTPMPLHKCDIYGSKRAGNLLKKALQSGRTTTLKEILKNLTGSDEISADALLEYFQPLIKWIEDFMKLNSNKV